MVSKAVFVGNVPYDLTEEQLADIFRQCGPVRGFRLVFDKDTGRPKGFGFCEYGDASSAASAIRNLDGYEVGGRALRVSTSGDGDRSSGTPQPQQQLQAQMIPPIPQHFAGAGVGAVPPPGMLMPPVPPPGMMPPWAMAQQQQNNNARSSMTPQPPTLPQQPPMLGSATATPAPEQPMDAISKTLSTLPPAQLLEVVSQLRQLAVGGGEAGRGQLESLLRNSPALTYAVLQALLLMNLVDVAVVQKVLRGESVESVAGTAPVVAPAAAVQAPPQPAAQTSMPPSTGDPSKDALVRQILALDQTQIDALPPDQRAQVLAIKSRILAGSF